MSNNTNRSVIKKNKHGMTTIELLLALSIMSLVVFFVFSLHIFGIRAMAGGKDLSDVQYEARLAALNITNDIRIAGEVEILETADTIPSIVLDDYIYIFAESISGKEVIISRSSEGDRILGEFSNVDVSFATEGVNKNLYFNIEGVNRGRSFSIDSRVIPLNMPVLNAIINTNGVALKYSDNINMGLPVESIYINLNPPDALVGSTYNHNFILTGGTAPYSFEITDGSLPAGITMNPITGQLTGTPILAGTYVFKMSVVDSSLPQGFGNRTFTVVISDTGVPSGPNTPPEAQNVNVTLNGEEVRNANLGDTLNGEYTYVDNEGNPELGTAFQWYRVRRAGDPAEMIPGAIYSTYTVSDVDKNNYLYFEVTPKSSVAPSVGNSVASLYIRIRN